MFDIPSLVVDWLYTLSVHDRLYLAGDVLGGIATAMIVRLVLKQRWSTAILAGFLVFLLLLIFVPAETYTATYRVYK